MVMENSFLAKRKEEPAILGQAELEDDAEEGTADDGEAPRGAGLAEGR